MKDLLKKFTHLKLIQFDPASQSLFSEKRRVFEVGGGTETAPETKATKAEILKMADIEKKFQEELKTGVDFKPGDSPSDTFDRIAEKLYPASGTEKLRGLYAQYLQSKVEKTLSKSYDQKSFDINKLWTQAKEKGAVKVKIVDHQLKFYKDAAATNALEIGDKKVARGVPIEGFDELIPKDSKDYREQVGVKETREGFEKLYKRSKVRVITNGIAEGEYQIRIPGETGVPTIKLDGQRIDLQGSGRVNWEKTSVKSGKVVEVKTGTGETKRLVEVDISRGKKANFAWIEEKYLFNNDKKEQVTTLSDWNEVKASKEQTPAQTEFTIHQPTSLLNGKGQEILPLKPGTKVETTTIAPNTRDIDGVPYVNIVYKAGGSAIETGWVAKDAFAHAGVNETVNLMGRKLDFKEMADKEKKYSVDENGDVTVLDGKLKITDILDLKKGDRLKVTSPSGKSFNYGRFNGNDVTFESGPRIGQHIGVQKGSKISYAPNEVTANRLPEGIPYAGTLTLKGDETYAEIAQKVFAKEGQFADSSYDRIRASGVDAGTYSKILKDTHDKYGTGNLLFFVIPNKQDVEVYNRAAAETRGAEGAFKDAANNAATEKGYRQYLSEEYTVQVDPKIARLLKTSSIDDTGIADYDNLSPEEKQVVDQVKDPEGHTRALWDHYWETGKIEGIQRVKQVLREERIFKNIPPDQAKNAIYKLMQKGNDETVDLEDIVDFFQLYKEEVQTDYGLTEEKLSFSPLIGRGFKKEYEQVKAKVEGYPQSKREAFQTSYRQMQEETKYVETLTQKIKAAEKRGDQAEANKLIAEAQRDPNYAQAANKAHAFWETPEAKEYESWEKENRRFTYLNDILRGSAKLLDSLGGLKTVETTQADYYDEQAREFRSLKRSDEIIKSKEELTYHSVKTLLTDQPEAIDSNNEKQVRLSLSEKAKAEFQAILDGLNPVPSEEVKARFQNDAEILKLLLRIYTPTTLMNEKALKQVDPPGNNNFVVDQLPKSLKTSEVFKLFLQPQRIENGISRGGNASPEYISALRRSLDENRRCLQVLSQIFHFEYDHKITVGQGAGRELTWSDVLGKEAGTKDTKDFFEQHYTSDAAYLRMKGQMVEYDGARENFKEEKMVKHLNLLMKQGLDSLISQEKIDMNALQSKYGVNSIKDLVDKLEVKTPPGLLKPLTEDQIELIKIGFVTNEKLTEARETQALSRNPVVRQTQEELLRQGYPKDEIKNVEVKMCAVAPFVFIDTTRSGWEKLTIGAGTKIDLGKGWAIGFGGGINAGTGQPTLAIGIYKNIKLNEKGDVSLTLGAGPALTPGGDKFVADIVPTAYVTMPMTDNWDISLGGGVGVLSLTPVGGVGFSYNAERARDNAIRDAEKLKGVDYIDSIPDKAAKAEAIKANPYFGKMFQELGEAGYLKSNDDVIQLYEQKKTVLKNAAAREQEVPFIIGFGVAASPDIANTALSVMGFLSFRIGTETTIVRQARGGSEKMSPVAEAKQNEEILRQVREQFKDPSIGIESFSKDKRLGRSNLLITDRTTGRIGVLQKESDNFIAQPSSLKEANARLKSSGIELVYDEKTGLTEVLIAGTEGNLEVCMDPYMDNAGLVVKGNRIFLASTPNPTLAFRRADFHFPMGNEGSSKHTIITISNNPHRGFSEIRENSTQIITKQPNLGLQILKGAGTSADEVPGYQGKKPRNNVLTYAQFQNPNAADGVPRGEMLMKESLGKPREEVVKDLDEMSEALGAREKGQQVEGKGLEDRNLINEGNVRRGLFESDKGKPAYIDQFWRLHQQEFRVLTTKGKPGETYTSYDFSKLRDLVTTDIRKTRKDLVKNPSEAYELNETELNLLLLKLTQKSFSELEGIAPASREKILEERLKWTKEKILTPLFEKKLRDRNKTVSDDKKLSDADISKHAAELAEVAVNDVRPSMKEVATNKKPNLLLIPGTQISVAVGTGNPRIEGLRSATYYSSIHDEPHGVVGAIDYTKYLHEDSQRGEIARLLLDNLSLVPKLNDQPQEAELKEFMGSPLAIKLASLKPIYFLFGQKDFQKLTSAYKKFRANPETLGLDAEETAAVKKLNDLATKIRETEAKGSNVLEYNGADGRKYTLGIDLRVGSGAYTKCGNYTMYADEVISVFPPKEGLAAFAGKGDAGTTVDANVAMAIYGFSLGAGVKVELPKPPPPPELPAPAPGEQGKVNQKMPGKNTPATDPNADKQKQQGKMGADEDGSKPKVDNPKTEGTPLTEPKLNPVAAEPKAAPAPAPAAAPKDPTIPLAGTLAGQPTAEQRKANPKKQTQ